MLILLFFASSYSILQLSLWEPCILRFIPQSNQLAKPLHMKAFSAGDCCEKQFQINRTDGF